MALDPQSKIDLWIDDTDRTLHARRADRFWLLGYTTMFLAPSLVLFLVRLHIVATVWLVFWLLYVFFVVRYFPRIQRRERLSRMRSARRGSALSPASARERWEKDQGAGV